MRRFRLMCLTAALFAMLAGMIPQQAQAATVRVFMSNFRFCNTPVCAGNENVTIRRGDIVEWVFADPACIAIHAIACFHTTTKSGTGGWSSGAMPGPAGTFGGTNPKVLHSVTFNSTGTFAYVCTLHSNAAAPFGPMAASVVVTS